MADALRRGDREALRRLEPGTVPAVIVASFASPDGRFEALWASEYVELEERPLGELCIIRQP